MTGSENGSEEKLNGEDEERGIAGEKKGKKHIFSLVLKFLLIALVLGIAFYFIYFRSDSGRVTFVLSDNEIHQPAESEMQKTFSANNRIYFHINRSSSPLNANILSLEIEVFKDKSFSHYKQISYEIEKDFQKIHTFIPEEYFRQSGKYRVKVYLDSKLVTVSEISVVQ